jgi:HEAT repeat protein
VKPAIAALGDALRNDADGMVRKYALFGLFHADLKQDQALRELVLNVALKDPVPIVRYQAAWLAAIQLGPDAQKVTQTLIDCYRDPRIHRYGGQKAEAQGSGEGKSGNTSVQETAGGDHRLAVVIGLGRIGKVAGPEAKKVLEEAARDDSKEIREEAKRALKGF